MATGEAAVVPGGRMAGAARGANLLTMLALALGFLVIPGALLVRDLSDPALRRPAGIPRFAWRLHRSLTPRLERWARERVASGLAGSLDRYNVPATEWPMFGCVFYLAATENLQRDWERRADRPAAQAPAAYARAAIEAATDLVMDPVHHTWVREHWGDNYLHRENCFFRAMLIQALTSREALLRDGRHSAFLRDQVETLAADLDRSPHGWMNDYPDECYPIDVFAAVACIRRADAVLGTDHSAFVRRALRGFEGARLDACGLPPYFADPDTGFHATPSRGIGNSYVLIYAPELYPGVAHDWYERYERHFWQKRIGAAGFREYPKDYKDANGRPQPDWFVDVDSGPVIAGFSPSGNAYGVAAARANGRFDHAWTLSAQVLAATWPLPNGRLVGARLLSDPVHAPYLGEANLLFLFTQMPAPGVTVRTGGGIPHLVWGALALFYFGLGGVAAASAWRQLRRLAADGWRCPARAERAQVAVWLALMIAATALLALGRAGPGVVVLLAAQFLPRAARRAAYHTRVRESVLPHDPAGTVGRPTT